MTLIGDFAYLYRTRHQSCPSEQAAATCEHCGVRYRVQPLACVNCGSRHFKVSR